MKRIISVLLVMLLAFSLVACQSVKGGDNDNDKNRSEGMPNPVKEVSVEEAAKGLCVEEIEFEDGFVLVSCNEIAGEINNIYSFDVTRDDKEYNVRAAISADGNKEDISGIYLNGKIDAAVYDSNNVDAPSVEVRKDSKYIVAECVWNGITLTVSTASKNHTLDQMQKICVDIADMLIDYDNIYKYGSSVINPVTSADFDQAVKELGIPAMNVNNIMNVYERGQVEKISGENDIYSFEFEKEPEDYEFDVRITKDKKIDATSLSGVYLGDTAKSIVYNEEDEATSPEIITYADSENAIALCRMNGFTMTVSAEELSNQQIYEHCLVFARMLLAQCIID